MCGGFATTEIVTIFIMTVGGKTLKKPSLSSLPVLTQPAGELPEGDQVVAVLVQQGEGAVGQRVGVLVGAAGPRHQQPVQALELRTVQPVLPLHVGVTVPPRCRLCSRRRAGVTPVQADEVLSLDEGKRRRKRSGKKVHCRELNISASIELF